MLFTKTLKASELDNYREQISNESCKECNSSLYSIEEEVEIIEDFAELAQQSGATLEMISPDTERR